MLAPADQYLEKTGPPPDPRPTARTTGILISLLAHNVHVYGQPDGPPMLFAHGFGCEQSMWRLVAPEFESTHRVILFDLMGLGGSDVSQYDPERYSTLEGYAEDVLEICDELALKDVVFVGHSVSSMIGVLAAKRRPELFSKLVLVGPSPRYVDEPADAYVGGFSRTDIDELLETLASNHLGWSAGLAPVVMGNADRPALTEELTERFCQADPDILHRFATATFLGDNRADLRGVEVPCLVLQCTDDMIAPETVGRYVASQLTNAQFQLLDAVGHCPNLSAPEETTTAIRAFL